jgi:hypothetical protein
MNLARLEHLHQGFYPSSGGSFLPRSGRRYHPRENPVHSGNATYEGMAEIRDPAGPTRPLSSRHQQEGGEKMDGCTVLVAVVGSRWKSYQGGARPPILAASQVRMRRRRGRSGGGGTNAGNDVRETEVFERRRPHTDGSSAPGAGRERRGAVARARPRCRRREADPRAHRCHCWSFMDAQTHRTPPLHPDPVAAPE